MTNHSIVLLLLTASLSLTHGFVTPRNIASTTTALPAGFTWDNPSSRNTILTPVSSPVDDFWTSLQESPLAATIQTQAGFWKGLLASPEKEQQKEEETTRKSPVWMQAWMQPAWEQAVQEPIAVKEAMTTVPAATAAVKPTALATKGDWSAYLDHEDTGLVYYYNRRTRASQWSPPSASFPSIDAAVAAVTPLCVSGSWSAYRDPETQRIYYHDSETGVSQWKAPFSSMDLAQKERVYTAKPLAKRGAWSAYQDFGSKKVYFYSEITRQAQWEAPREFCIFPPRFHVEEEVKDEKWELTLERQGEAMLESLQTAWQQLQKVAAEQTNQAKVLKRQAALLSAAEIKSVRPSRSRPTPLNTFWLQLNPNAGTQTIESRSPKSSWDNALRQGLNALWQE